RSCRSRGRIGGLPCRTQYHAMHRIGHEIGRRSQHAFRSTQHKEAIAREIAPHLRQNIALAGIIEIDEDVPAKDDIDIADDAEVTKKIKSTEIDLRAQRVLDLPLVAPLIEVAQQVWRWQAALHLEL